MADKKKKPTVKKPSSKKTKPTKPKDKKSRSVGLNPLTDMERVAGYPGITEQIRRFENAKLPPCPHCRSKNTAGVQVGFIGRTMSIANTQKFKIVLNGSDRAGEYFCNACQNSLNPISKSRALALPSSITRKLKYPTTQDDDEYLELLEQGGYMIGAIAKLLFPEAIAINERNSQQALQATQELIAQENVTLLEAAFLVRRKICPP